MKFVGSYSAVLFYRQESQNNQNSNNEIILICYQQFFLLFNKYFRIYQNFLVREEEKNGFTMVIFFYQKWLQ